MKEVSVISPLPIQVPDPVSEDAMDELLDPLVPAQEDELPQGVLELVASLIRLHRPAMETVHPVAWESLASPRRTTHVEREGIRAPTPVTMPHPPAGPLLGKPVHRPLPPMVPVAAFIDKVTAPTPMNLLPSIADEPVLIERPTVEPRRAEHIASSSAPPASTFDEPLPESLLSLQAPRHGSQVARAFTPLPVSLQPLPALDVMLETLPGPDKGLLQVPFNKGAASGQVTISRVPDEPARNLQLSPSNVLVFEQLKVPFELAREPAWRLTDSGGEQQRQGSRQSPDDEQAEQSEHPA